MLELGQRCASQFICAPILAILGHWIMKRAGSRRVHITGWAMIRLLIFLYDGRCWLRQYMQPLQHFTSHLGIHTWKKLQCKVRRPIFLRSGCHHKWLHRAQFSVRKTDDKGFSGLPTKSGTGQEKKEGSYLFNCTTFDTACHMSPNCRLLSFLPSFTHLTVAAAVNCHV